jgi:hypothetical protein
MPFLAFLSGPWGIVLKIGAIVLVIGTIWLNGRHNGVESMIPKVEEAESRAESYAKTAQNYKTALNAQNQAIERIKEESDRKARELNKRLATAILEGQKIREAAANRETTILTLKTTGTECEQVFQLIDEARK